jgi:hypothetical protein
MKSFGRLAWVLGFTGVSWIAPARADIPADDCMTKTAGATCTDFSGKKGICVGSAANLLCDTTASMGGGGNGGAAGSGNAAAGGSGNTLGGGVKPDTGCSIGARARGRGAGLFLLALAAGLLPLVRRRRR